MTAVVSVAPARQESTEIRRARRIEAFEVRYRRSIRDLASRADEIEDLADTFPALLFALATGYGSEPDRERCVDLVCRGASLRRAANALGLPLWLRRLPAQAFTEPLPVFPLQPDYALRIASLIPRSPELAAQWLRRVGDAQEASGSEFALWMARHANSNCAESVLVFMAAWAWFSQRPGLAGHRLLRRAWNPEMSFKRAWEETAAWRHRVRLLDHLGTGIETPWLNDATVGGFSFVALRTVDDFIGEAAVLDNCLDQYADKLCSGQRAVFSIRKGARHVACVEIGLHEQEATMPAIVQLRGPRNRRASPEIWQAAYAWLGSQRLEPISPERHMPKQANRLTARRRLWLPYFAFLENSSRVQLIRRTLTARPGGRPYRRVRPRARADVVLDGGSTHADRKEG